jgi:hypothetical protein
MGTTASNLINQKKNDDGDVITPDKFKNLEPSFILDSDVNDKVKKLNSYINDFNTNDTKTLLSVIKEFQEKTNKTSGTNYNFDQIEQFILNFHQSLQKELDSSEDNRKISDILNNDDSLKKYLDEMKTHKTDEIFKDIINNDTVKNNGALQTNIKNILNNINNMNVKHKFFEYKYIQINLFLIIFIQHTMSTMQDFIEKVTQYSLLRDAKKRDSIDELVKILLQLLNDSRVQLDPENFNVINNMVKTINSDINSNQKKLNDKINTIKDASFNEIVKFLYNNAFTEQNIVNQFNPDETPIMKGGFIKGNSVIPQEFYNL